MHECIRTDAECMKVLSVRAGQTNYCHADATLSRVMQNLMRFETDSVQKSVLQKKNSCSTKEPLKSVLARK